MTKAQDGQGLESPARLVGVASEPAGITTARSDDAAPNERERPVNSLNAHQTFAAALTAEWNRRDDDSDFGARLDELAAVAKLGLSQFGSADDFDTQATREDFTGALLAEHRRVREIAGSSPGASLQRVLGHLAQALDAYGVDWSDMAPGDDVAGAAS